MLALLGGIAGPGATASATADKPSIPDEVQDHIRKRVGPDGPSGIVVGMVGEGGSAFFAFGASAQDGPKLDEDSVFEIGSVTKAFTAMLLADALLRGELKLDDPVSQYLPSEVKLPSKGDTPITLEHLSTHRSGLPRMPGNFMPKDPANPYADYTPALMYAFLGECELTAEPGAAYAYSNLGAGLLGHALALKAGKSYDELVRERLCVPLGMKRTACVLTPDMKTHLAMGHSGGKQVSNWDLDALAGAGAIRSTARDMTAFLAACLAVSSDTIKPVMSECLKPRYSAGMVGMEVALGWHVDKRHGSEIIWHNGGTGGYHSYCGFRPDTKLGVVVLANSSEDTDDIGQHLLAPAAELAKVRTAVPIDPATLDEYVGSYQLAPGAVMRIAREGEGLTVQLTGQDAFPIFAEAKDKFFLKVVDAQLTFARDDAGKVIQLILHQNNMDQTAKRLPPGEEPKARTEVKVDRKILETYVGKYQLGPAVFDVRLDGDKLTAQLTGQQRIEVFPESEIQFFYKVVDAQITFVKDADGKVTSLILHQGGRDQTAKRMEP